MRTIVSLTTLLLVGRKKKKSVESTSGRAVLVSSTLLLLMLLSVQILLETDLDGKKTQFLFLIKVVFTFLYLHVISLFLVQKKFALFFLLFGNLDMKWNQNVVRSFYTGSNSNLLSVSGSRLFVYYLIVFNMKITTVTNLSVYSSRCR